MVKKTNQGAVVGIISGIVIIILAIVMLCGANNLSSSSMSTSSKFQLSYSFGADFYTEMFGVTYNILEQLGDMSSDNAKNILVATNAITRSLGFIVLAIGIGVLGLSFCRLNIWVPHENHPVSGSEPDSSDPGTVSQEETNDPDNPSEEQDPADNNRFIDI